MIVELLECIVNRENIKEKIEKYMYEVKNRLVSELYEKIKEKIKK